jgi:ribosomal-protein-alanine N-acetyltransferase
LASPPALGPSPEPPGPFRSLCQCAHRSRKPLRFAWQTNGATISSGRENYGVWIETARLILRAVTMDDVEQVALSWNLDGPPISRQEAESQVIWMLENHEQNAPGRLKHLCLAMIEKEAQAFIGWCGLDYRDQTRPAPVLFYLLKASYWGKGLATEAARAVLGYAFGELGLDRVDGAAALENVASKRVMEKIGMRYLGLNEEGGHSFTLIREEYFDLMASGEKGSNDEQDHSRADRVGFAGGLRRGSRDGERPLP